MPPKSKNMLNINGKSLMLNLRAANEPITVEEILCMFGGTELDKTVRMEVKKELRKLIASAMKLGFVQSYNNHYFASSHIEDIAEVIDLEADDQNQTDFEDENEDENEDSDEDEDVDEDEDDADDEDEDDDNPDTTDSST